MLRPLMLSTAGIICLLTTVILHACCYDYAAHEKTLKAMATLSQIGTLSFSTSPFESRFYFYEPPMHISYPELMAIDRMSYIYE